MRTCREQGVEIWNESIPLLNGLRQPRETPNYTFSSCGMMHKTRESKILFSSEKIYAVMWCCIGYVYKMQLSVLWK